MGAKAVLIALAAFTAFDAAAWDGHYRQATVLEARVLIHWVMTQNWSSFLVGG